jgi:hypothetical protein
MSDPQFDRWRVILKLAAKHKTKGPFRQALIAAGILVNHDLPISGFYQKQRDTGEVDAVGIWYKGDVLFVYWGKEPVSRLHQVWPGCIWHPIPKDWYLAKVKEGKEFPNVHDYRELPEDEPETTPGPGHNSGASESELDALKRKIAVAKGGTAKYATITSDEQRDRSQDLRSELLVYSRTAKQTREVLNAPLRAQIEKNNNDWKTLEDDAKAAADQVRAAQEAWGTLKLQQRREEEQRLAAEQKERERQQEQLAIEAQAAVERGEAPPEPLFQAPPPASAPERVAPETTFRGGRGRAAHEKIVLTITKDDVTDWGAFIAYFVNNAAVRTEAVKQANIILKDRGEIAPGCTPREVAKVA